MNLKIALYIICIVTAVTSCGGGGTQKKSAKTTTQNTQSMLTVEIDTIPQNKQDTINLGKMKQGEIVKSEFAIYNKTNSPLVIIDIKVACGCAKATYNTKPIMPSENRIVNFTFDSKGMRGAQYKFFDIQMISADDKHKNSENKNFKVHFTAEVIE